VHEREDANRTREAGSLDKIEGVVANRPDLHRVGAVGFIDWLDLAPEFPLMVLTALDSPHRGLTGAVSV